MAKFADYSHVLFVTDSHRSDAPRNRWGEWTNPTSPYFDIENHQKPNERDCEPMPIPVLIDIVAKYEPRVLDEQWDAIGIMGGYGLHVCELDRRSSFESVIRIDKEFLFPKLRVRDTPDDHADLWDSDWFENVYLLGESTGIGLGNYDMGYPFVHGPTPLLKSLVTEFAETKIDECGKDWPRYYFAGHR
jgi:hypothetical protein